MTLFDRFADCCSRYADRVAIETDVESTTYGELAAQSRAIADALRAAGVRAGDRVGLLTPKSPAAVATMLACLRLGAPYVPIDAKSPPARTARILLASDPRVVCAAAPRQPAAQSAYDALEGLRRQHGRSWRWLGLDQAFECGPRRGRANDNAAPGGDLARAEGPEAWPRPPAADAADAADAAGVRDTDVAHLLFTSGSTGEPKGVSITHANVLAFLDWALPHFGIGADDRLSAHPPLHFDLSTFDVFGALTTGATLLPVPDALNLAPKRLAAWIRDQRLTQWFSVPAVFQLLAKHDALAAAGPFPDLRRIMWCGEVLPVPILRCWQAAIPAARFTNLYGPTEATIASTYYDVTADAADGDELPIGTPCDGEDVLLLDPDRAEPVPAADRSDAGTFGEIAIRGAGLSPGYWRDETRTAHAFPPDPERPGERIYRTGDLGERDAAGYLWFRGRRDQQIKSRGYRIELGEIETALHELPGLDEVAVVATVTSGFEGTRICAAYVAATADAASPAELRRALATRLPTYMLPSEWLALPALPKNANGKIDRVRLRAMFVPPPQAPSAAPR